MPIHTWGEGKASVPLLIVIKGSSLKELLKAPSSRHDDESSFMCRTLKSTKSERRVLNTVGRVEKKRLREEKKTLPF